MSVTLSTSIQHTVVGQPVHGGAVFSESSSDYSDFYTITQDSAMPSVLLHMLSHQFFKNRDATGEYFYSHECMYLQCCVK